MTHYDSRYVESPSFLDHRPPFQRVGRVQLPGRSEFTKLFQQRTHSESFATRRIGSSIEENFSRRVSFSSGEPTRRNRLRRRIPISIGPTRTSETCSTHVGREHRQPVSGGKPSSLLSFKGIVAGRSTWNERAWRRSVANTKFWPRRRR